MLASADELQEMLGDPGTVVVDARAYGPYSKSHIPGAVNLDLFAFHWADTTPEGIRGFGAQAARLLSFVGAQGRRLVFYDDVSGMLAARGVWMARYMSHPGASMLDGGMRKWLAEGRPSESGTNAPSPSGYRGAPDPGIIAGYGYVRDNMERLALVDARAPAEYGGAAVRAAHAGHIPGARNVDWVRNVGPDGAFLPAGELRALYGIPEGSEIVAYCQGAYRAANAYVALKLAGHRDVRLYLGSWGEWGNLDLPASRG